MEIDFEICHVGMKGHGRRIKLGRGKEAVDK
jgi:hypothetical protein